MGLAPLTRIVTNLERHLLSLSNRDFAARTHPARTNTGENLIRTETRTRLEGHGFPFVGPIVPLTAQEINPYPHPSEEQAERDGNRRGDGRRCSIVTGVYVRKETIALAVAYPGRSMPESLGVIANTKKSILNLVHRLSPGGGAVGFCYEAGPCGYEVHRLIKETGQDCEVVAPSMILKKPGERVKTNRRDAVKFVGKESLKPTPLTLVFSYVDRSQPPPLPAGVVQFSGHRKRPDVTQRLA